MASVSVVILNFNGRHHLEKFLPSVIKCSSGHEIVVADNSSTDGSVDFIKEHYPQITLIVFSENHGFCGGYNKAIAQLDSEYVVILNSDIEVTPNWIAPVLALFEKDDKIKLMQHHA